MAVRYPIAVIDFEASSLEHGSYPIEVGVAICDQAGGAMRCWSALIRPTGSWSMGGHWSKASQRIHGITREELADGMAVREAMQQLNTLLSPVGAALYDGGEYDLYWLARLADAARIEPTFALHDWAQAFGADQDALKNALEWLHASPTPHRAEADTQRLLRALLMHAGTHVSDDVDDA